MKIVVQGCCHGSLDQIYASIKLLEQKSSVSVDLLIICGDFQALRNIHDLTTLACPDKYKSMGDFYKYYSGEKTAPVPTVFIGGNHEASGYLWELQHGGYVAPNIYFVGFCGVVRFGGLRIAGLSGIFKEHDYHLGRHEQFPLNQSDMRSIYHVRKYDVFKLAQLETPVDVLLTHDWPTGIAYHGNYQDLIRKKPFLQSEIEDGTLGSKPAEFFLNKLKPAYHFSAHMHVKFSALVTHGQSQPQRNPDEIEISDDDSETTTKSNKRFKTDHSRETKFLALSKCLPGHDFLQLIDVPVESSQEKVFMYDEEWLAVIKASMPYYSRSHEQLELPSDQEFSQLKQKMIQEIQIKAEKDSKILVPHEFVMTAPPHLYETDEINTVYQNPQTTLFCSKLSIQDYTFS